MLDLIFAVLGISLVLVIVVPGVYNYVKSVSYTHLTLPTSDLV